MITNTETPKTREQLGETIKRTKQHMSISIVLEIHTLLSAPHKSSKRKKASRKCPDFPNSENEMSQRQIT